MSAQPLFEVAPKLRERQQLVYGFLAQQTLTAEVAGKLLHASCRHCRPGAPCMFMERNGREVLEALRKKGLAKRDKHHVYRRADGTSPEPDSDGYDPATADIPF